MEHDDRPEAPRGRPSQGPTLPSTEDMQFVAQMSPDELSRARERAIHDQRVAAEQDAKLKQIKHRKWLSDQEDNRLIFMEGVKWLFGCSIAAFVLAYVLPMGADR